MVEVLSKAKVQSVKEIKRNAKIKRRNKLLVKLAIVIVILIVITFLITNFVITNKSIKKEIRIEAEKGEHIFYTTRVTNEWLEALEPLGTDEHKLFLEEAPCLIAIFSKKTDVLPNGKKVKQYYVQESVGIATGFLIAALHNAGLATLTHTPSPMGFLNKILNRPEYEKPFLLLVVGYPAEGAKVPNIHKKNLNEIADFKE